MHEPVASLHTKNGVVVVVGTVCMSLWLHHTAHVASVQVSHGQSALEHSKQTAGCETRADTPPSQHKRLSQEATDSSFSMLGGLAPSTIIPQKQEELKSTPLTPMTFQYW